MKGWHLLWLFGLLYVRLPFKSLAIVLNTTPSVDPFEARPPPPPPPTKTATTLCGGTAASTQSNRKMIQEKCSSNLFLEMTVTTGASQSAAGVEIRLDLLTPPNFYLRERQVHTYFLFSVQFIAAVYPFLSNHQCPYPHIPTSGSYKKRKKEKCLLSASWQPSNCNSLPRVFSQRELISRCASLDRKKPTFSLSDTFSVFPVSDAVIPLSHSASLSFSIIVSLRPAPPRSIWWVRVRAFFTFPTCSLLWTAVLFFWLPSCLLSGQTQLLCFRLGGLSLSLISVHVARPTPH